MDIAALIESFITQGGTYSVQRRQNTGFSRGIANAPTLSTLTIRACVQPATGKDLLRLPEGRRSNETRALFTTTQLYTGDIASAFQADQVIIDGDPWEVQHVEDWNQGGAMNQNGATAYRIIVQAPTPESNS